MRSAADQQCSERVIVDIQVVRQQTWRRNRDRPALVSGVAVEVHHRAVVDGADIDCDGGDARLQRAVTNAITETVLAVIMTARDVNERTIRVQSEDTMLRRVDDRRYERIAIRVAVVA